MGSVFIKRFLSSIVIIALCYALSFGPTIIMLTGLGCGCVYELLFLKPRYYSILYGVFVIYALFMAAQLPSQKLWLTFLIVWIFDTGSFIVGSILQGPKIAPAISPGKTWSGIFGGFLSVFLFKLLYATNLQFFLLFCLAAFFGDLIESAIKRRCHIKDSSNLIPGHGGFLDRFDAFFPVAILMNYC